MKIETFKPPKNNKADTISALLRNLEPGQAVRLKTASEFRNSLGAISFIAKERKLKFGTTNDGDDVLLFIKPKSQTQNRPAK